MYQTNLTQLCLEPESVKIKRKFFVLSYIFVELCCNSLHRVCFYKYFILYKMVIENHWQPFTSIYFISYWYCQKRCLESLFNLSKLKKETLFSDNALWVFCIYQKSHYSTFFRCCMCYILAFVFDFLHATVFTVLGKREILLVMTPQGQFLYLYLIDSRSRKTWQHNSKPKNISNV